MARPRESVATWTEPGCGGSSGSAAVRRCVHSVRAPSGSYAETVAALKP
ncbi:hypothetical protein VSR01_34650 [Actinacidiphila sp. DG2A-62]|nr:hypothetical protein [Actinacidiphila sp. DG2A-62]MEC3998356.1 hypothetical protein [Actinacidiphila sp. DG2A-62]